MQILNHAKYATLSPRLLAYVAEVCRKLFCRMTASQIMHHESVTTTILHRREDLQAELVIGHPNGLKWPGEHRHPNVDSVEVAVFNNLGFTRNGQVVTAPDFIVHDMLCVRLEPTDWHGIPFMPLGFSLISVQQWLNGMAPSSVGLDWEGDPVSPGHAEQQKHHVTA